jgi:hypothetical protein
VNKGRQRQKWLIWSVLRICFGAKWGETDFASDCIHPVSFSGNVIFYDPKLADGICAPLSADVSRPRVISPLFAIDPVMVGSGGSARI